MMNPEVLALALDELRATVEADGRTFDEEAARRDIESAMRQFEYVRQERDHSVSGKERKARYDALLHAVRTAREGYEEALARPGMIKPLVWAWDKPDQPGVEEEIHKLIRALNVHEEWLTVAATKATPDPKGGRPNAGSLEREFVSGLASVWFRHVGRRVGYSQPPGGGEAYGPFVRFAIAVAGAAGMTGITATQIKSTLDSRRRENSGHVLRRIVRELFGPVESE